MRRGRACDGSENAAPRHATASRNCSGTIHDLRRPKRALPHLSTNGAHSGLSSQGSDSAPARPILASETCSRSMNSGSAFDWKPKGSPCTK